MSERTIHLARGVVALFLVVHYAEWLSHAEALFGASGTLPSPSDNPFPLPLLGGVLEAIFAWPAAFVAVMIALSLCHGLSIFPRASALLLFLGMVLSFHRNQLILNPSMPFLALWLVSHAVMPRSASHDGAFWSRHRDVMWWITGAAYTFSGLTKLMSPSWRSGDAGAFILQSPLGRDHALVRLLEEAPDLLVAGTYAMLALELLLLPLALSRRLRPWAWLALIGLHLALLATVHIADITLGMLAFHLTQLEPEWLRRLHPSLRRADPSSASIGNSSSGPCSPISSIR